MNRPGDLTMRMMLAAVLAASAFAQKPVYRTTEFEQQPAVTLTNDKLELTLTMQGASLVNLVLLDDPEKISPLWNPVRMTRELGQAARPSGGATGHFVCVDGFGGTSAEERAAGLPGHGEAHVLTAEIRGSSKEGKTATITFYTRLPLVQETLTRTFHMVDGENVIYLESALASETAFDRPISWAEHTTLGSPFLQSGVTLSNVSGTRAQNRPYQGTGSAAMTRRLASGVNFTWPMAPDLAGKLIDLTAPPQDAHYMDHATVLVDPALRLGWVATVNTARRLLIGYMFRREDFPWVQNWGSFPATGKFARGLELSTQPYDEPRRVAVAKNPMFDASTFRWLPAKSTIHTSLLLFYAHTPESFGKVTDVRLENGQITVEDSAKHRITLAASRPL